MREVFEKMTKEELVKKIADFNQMIRFYKFSQNGGMVQQLTEMIRICYEIIDERDTIQYMKDYGDMTSGVAIDTGKEPVKKDEAPPKIVGRKPVM